MNPGKHSEATRGRAAQPRLAGDARIGRPLRGFPHARAPEAEAVRRTEDGVSSVYQIQVASDVIRQGPGVELLDPSGAVIAEVFRSDRAGTILLNTFGNGVPFSEMERLIAAARYRL